MIKIFIRENQVYSKPLEYILLVLAKNKSFSVTFSNDKSSANLIFDHTDPQTLPINLTFFDSLLNRKKYNHEFYFKHEPLLFLENSAVPDWLGTSFYMINAFQEYGLEFSNDSFDNYGRFKFEKSYQKKFTCIQENLVQKYFDNFCKDYLNTKETQSIKQKSKVFISHDVDTINGSFLQDGLWAIKRGRLDVVLKLIMNEILMNPHWKNMDKIVKLHSENDLKSTFFWLVTKKISENKVKNADYSIQKHNNLLKITQSNGLHKSCYHTSINEELEMLPISTNLNRFHFLKFNLPSSWEILDNSPIRLDASLGFAENYGFRNNYGLPFKPYNSSTQSFHGIIEMPLNVMDGTLHRYMNVPINLTAIKIIDFFEKHKTNCILSILWHNTYFTDYKYAGFFNEYKKIITYLVESGIKSITPNEIIDEYSNY